MKGDYWDLITAKPAVELAREVQRLEALGLHGVWAYQLFSPPFPTLAAAAMASTKLKIGTGIALAFTRSPVETALNALDLDRISGGRMVLGLGTSIRSFNQNVHGVEYGKPVAHLREVTEAVRAIIEQGHTGKLDRFDGTYFKADYAAGNFFVSPPVRPSIPIWLPALFDNTIDLAATIGDGLIGHPMWSLKSMASSAVKVETLLARTGKERSKFHINFWNYVAIANDRKAAIDSMRSSVAFYASIAQYEKYFASHGFGAEARRASEAAARKDTAAMVSAIPDEMVTTFAIAGTPDDARERVDQMWRYADSLTLLPAPYAPLKLQATYGAAIADTFYRS